MRWLNAAEQTPVCAHKQYPLVFNPIICESTWRPLNAINTCYVTGAAVIPCNATPCTVASPPPGTSVLYTSQLAGNWGATCSTAASRITPQITSQGCKQYLWTLFRACRGRGRLTVLSVEYTSLANSAMVDGRSSRPAKCPDTMSATPCHCQGHGGRGVSCDLQCQQN